MEYYWNDTNQETLKYLEKSYLSATLSTRNPTGTGWGLNLVLHSMKLVTNHLRHDMTLTTFFLFLLLAFYMADVRYNLMTYNETFIFLSSENESYMLLQFD